MTLEWIGRLLIALPADVATMREDVRVMRRQLCRVEDRGERTDEPMLRLSRILKKNR